MIQSIVKYKIAIMFRRVSHFFIFLMYTAIPVSEGKYRYDYSFDQAAGGWLKLHEAPATFFDAFLRCKLEGAVLASPLNDNMKKAMVKKQDASNVNCGIYTGIHASISKGDFTSIEGVPLARIPVIWAPEEPDNFENQEDCTIMLRNGSMADTRCNETFPYVCYKKRVTSLVITACGTVDPGYTLYGSTGSCYKFHAKGKTWQQAQMTCIAEGGHLAIINSDTEATVLKKIFTTFASIIAADTKDIVSLGFLDWNKKGSWFTVDGQSLEEAGYMKWAPGQPDSPGLANCGAMFKTALLDNVGCETKPYAFICEKTTDSLLSNDEE